MGREKTDTPTCQPQAAFTVQYGECRVPHRVLGHGVEAWNNPAFTEALDRAVRGATGRLRSE